MTDPELQALVLKMFDALMDRKPLERRAQADICARVAADFFAERLARADAIEQAAREVVAHFEKPLPEFVVTSPPIGALRAALEAS